MLSFRSLQRKWRHRRRLPEEQFGNMLLLIVGLVALLLFIKIFMVEFPGVVADW